MTKAIEHISNIISPTFSINLQVDVAIIYPERNLHCPNDTRQFDYSNNTHMHPTTPFSRLIALSAMISLLSQSHFVSAQSIPPLGGGAVDAQAEMGMSTVAELPGGSSPATNAQTSTVDPSAAAPTAAAAGNTSIPTEQPPTPDYESLMEPFYLFRQRFLGTDVSRPIRLPPRVRG